MGEKDFRKVMGLIASAMDWLDVPWETSKEEDLEDLEHDIWEAMTCLEKAYDVLDKNYKSI
jgi:hypothetical protein